MIKDKYMENINYQNVIAQLLKTLPEFSRTYKKLLTDFDDDVGQHIIFGELTRFTIRKYKIAAQMQKKDKVRYAAALDVVKKIIKFIEVCLMARDPKVRELAAFSFLENLWQAGKYYNAMKGMLSKGAKTELERIDVWWEHLGEQKAASQS
ncbi:MAG: hypothetical protein A2445_03535 [Candidatus Jacksonbacteria bacterium RIFOXYC2_FULL_44_29]|nr:MAG: hypothetical protein A2240_03060 [Candidatus Jacksonbacteria bacterium RIFOXYA2_FULL_43_12]OGY76963.1 MAG: hypothetical protein A2295_01170 [Candidatus Jacksonbacteria bacterium RIFOXYB2_FULL_44_15]OGY79123.1 MAG: hypothetical protein A2550_01430 [Candidatus Jacksonbacteria bacterium RIFOXYD2_FULL_43_21]OGY80498.1 MAG: hypothetical protein A2445_03535 [Candidatus Jacksonbacteria bacterium RIFOXYC2_FULL_44_29]HBH46058.1 hypothetical protein [Candidatus Jacksonbacteria bacterium]